MGFEVVGFGRGLQDLVEELDFGDLLGEREDFLFAFFQRRGECGHDVGFFLEDEG